FQKFGDVLKDNFSFSFKTILKLLLLMLLCEIKGSSTQIFTNIVPLLKKSPILAMVIFSNIVKIKNHLQGRQITNTQLTNIKENHKIYLTINVNFMIALYKYLHSSTKFKFDKLIVGVNISNTKDRFMIERISNI